MQDRLIELKQRFIRENNELGEKFADALSAYMADFKEEILKNTKESPDVHRKVGKVVNCLVDKQDVKLYLQKNMYPIVKGKGCYMIERAEDDRELLQKINNKMQRNVVTSIYGERFLAGYVFFGGTYTQLTEYILKQDERRYEAVVSFEDGEREALPYYITYSPILTEYVKGIWKLSKLYGDESPIAYIPYAARFLQLDFDIDVLSNATPVKGIDLQLEKYGLREYLLFNRELLWNVKLEDGGLGVEPVMRPTGDVIHWRYSFSQVRENQYIVPASRTWPTYQVLDLPDGELVLDFEDRKVDSFQKVTIYEVRKEDFDTLEWYQAIYNTAEQTEQFRLRSLADIRYELNKYTLGTDLRIAEITFLKKKEFKTVVSYFPDAMLYEKGRFGYKNTNKVYVRFEKAPEDVFWEDHVNFVLSHLTYLYPEIGWEGVV